MKIIENLKEKFNNIKNKESNHFKNSDFDLEFISKIQPAGNIIFKENYIKKGDGFETCVEIYDYPETVRNFWLRTITNFNIENLIVTIDISTMDNAIVDSVLEKNLKENKYRTNNEKNITDRLKSKKDFQNSVSLHDKLYSNSINIKLVKIRIFLFDKSLKNLESEVVKLLNYLNGKSFKASIFLNELEYEYKSIYHPFKYQANSFYNKRNGKEITSETLGAGLDYNFSYLHDENGLIYGTTKGGGYVVFNPFLKNEQRKSYNGILMGKMGSGKSTFLKKLALNNYILGTKIRCFDASGEFKYLVKKSNGKMINLNNPNNIINPLQIYKSSLNNSSDEDIEDNFDNETDNEIRAKFYQNHLSKFQIFFRYLSPNLDETYFDELSILLDDFYNKINFYKITNGEKIFINITELNPNEYPILSDFLTYINTIYNDETDNLRKERLNVLELKLKTIVNVYGMLFNGYSTIDIQEEKLVVFNIKELATLPNNIFSAVIFNILNILWQEMINNVDISKYGNNIKDVKLNNYLVIIDEAHRILNDDLDNKTIKFFIDFEREARKYLGAIWLSYHTIDDAIKNDNVKKEINKIFNLSQYKVIFEQDIQLKEKLMSVFKDSITETEIDKISRFQIGECLLSLNTDNNIIFKVSLGLENERELIATGGK
ncbi:hypothetical protein VJI72_01280 [Parvimonas micra]|jgi:hypothetical protein|uniref:VirB4 family type IV secretion system protein n=1 Tax=Parvimonas micra TaxID=33033 RepID=UPI002B47FFD5|nr:hypothetical protein [Parvimonas micra]MEB3028423.1 hypothetical protein [Parvimonas micra]